MKTTQLAARDMEATKRIVSAADELADLLGIPTETLDRIKTQRGNVQTRAMLQREAVADLLQQTVKQVKGLVKAGSEATSTAKSPAKKSAKSGSK